MIEAHPAQALVERREQVLARAPLAVWAGPHVVAHFAFVGLAQVPALVARRSLPAGWASIVDIFYSHRVDPVTPFEETMGALDAAVRQGKAVYAGISSYSAERTREAAGMLAGSAPAADPPAVLLDDQPLDRAQAARRAGRRGRGLRSSSRRSRRTLKTILDGVPEDSRAAGRSCPTDLGSLEPDPVAAQSRSATGRRSRHGGRVDAARPARHVGADRRLHVDTFEQNVAALDNLDFSGEELAEIDRYAVESGINLWRTPATPDGAPPSHLDALGQPATSTTRTTSRSSTRRSTPGW